MKKLNYALLQAFLCIYVIELVYPPITTYFPSVYVVLGCMLGWLFVSFASDTQYYLNCSGRLLLILFCYLYASFMPRVAGNGMIGNRYMGMPMVFFGSIIYDFHKKTGTLKIVRNALVVAVAFSIFTFLTTIKALISDPYISRSIKSSGDHSISLAAMGIGGYAIIYYGTMLTPVLLHGYVHSTSKATRITLIGILILDLFLIVKSSYMTAIMLVIIMCSIYMAINIFTKPENRLAKFVLFGTGIALFLWFSSTQLSTILSVLPPRIQQIFGENDSQSLVSSIADEFLVDRWPEWLESIHALQRSPLLGIAITEVITQSGALLVGFGQHSFILDSYALYGFLLGTLIVVVALYAVLIPNRGIVNRKQKPLCVSMLVGTLVMYLFNNATDSIALAISLFYPYIRDHMGE